MPVRITDGENGFYVIENGKAVVKSKWEIKYKYKNQPVYEFCVSPMKVTYMNPEQFKEYMLG